METNNVNNFRGLNILYLSLLAGQVLITTVLIFLTKDSDIGYSWDMSNPFHLIAPFLMMTSIFLSTFLYSKKIQEGKNEKGFSQKFEHYRATIIIRSALLEGANLICIIFFFLESNYFFLFLFFIGLAAFLLVRPSKEVFKEKYKLNETERMELRKMVK